MRLQSKFKKLARLINSYKGVLVAFSGGCDSSFVLAAAVKILGTDRVYAATAVSETYTPSELTASKKLCRRLKVKQIIIRTQELKNKQFARNPFSRCYYCKDELFSKLHAIVRKKNIAHKKNIVVVDGMNLSDKQDFRPGAKAAKKWGVKHPLLDAGFTKADIRQASKNMKLPTWDLPAGACLASRIPFGQRITNKKLRMVAKGEKYLKSLGFKIVRVRTHESIARIEVGNNEIKNLLKIEIRNKIINYFNTIGYSFTTFDLQGYRTGPFNPS